MQYLPNGTVGFASFNELIYDYFMEMGLGIDANQYLYFQETGEHVIFDGKFIKASVDGTPVYGGMNDVVFDIRNYKLMQSLFTMYLEMCKVSDDGDILGGYIAHYIEDDGFKTGQRVTVKTVERGEISSRFYSVVFFAFIDCTFRISGYDVDLTPFDEELRRQYEDEKAKSKS